MILYTVKPGDSLGVLAVKYRTTIRILMHDNSFIPADQKLKAGWKLTIFTPEENARRHCLTGYALVEKMYKMIDVLEKNEHLLSSPPEPVYYKERLVLPDQIAFAKILKPTPLIEMQANGYKKTIRNLQKGELVGVYERIESQRLLLVDGYRWITSDPTVILYDEIPQVNLDGKIRINPFKNEKEPQVFARVQSMNQLATESEQQVPATPYFGYGVRPSADTLKVTPTSMIGFGPAPFFKEQTSGRASTPVFETPAFKRPIMVLKNAKGETKTIELRVLGFNASYSNSIQPAATNGGWMVNVGAHNLPVLTISGFLLETKGINEFNDFMAHYHKYLAANKNDDYYSIGISTLYYKQTEYKGIVVGFSHSENSQETLHRKYNMQLLVLKEKILSGTEYSDVQPLIDRGKMDEKTFRSDIGALLASTIVGTYYTDH